MLNPSKSGSPHLKKLGCVVSVETARTALTLRGIDPVTDGAVLTVSREVVR